MLSPISIGCRSMLRSRSSWGFRYAFDPSLCRRLNLAVLVEAAAALLLNQRGTTRQHAGILPGNEADGGRRRRLPVLNSRGD